MSIKYRLILSYIGMIVIPIIFIMIINFTFGFFLFEEKESLFDKFNPGKKISIYLHKSNELSRRMNIAALEDNEDIIGEAYIRTIEDEIKEFHGGVITRKDNEIVYVSQGLQGLVNVDALPMFREEYSREKYIKFNEGYAIGNQLDYYLNGSEYSLFIIANIEAMKAEFERAETILNISIICILIITTLILTYSVYKDIIKSIVKLRRAANEMKNGNLDYEIKKHLNDEIGELSSAFEEMRLRLKHSIEIQRKYDENRKNLISNISHDLKTPIMSIKGHIEGIKDGIADSPEKMNKYIDTIYQKSNDMELLINELFLFSRLDLEKEEFNFQTIDIIEFLEFSVEDLSFDLEKVSGKIDLSYDCEPVFVKADLQKLKRVVVNIVSNAIKYKREVPLMIDIYVKKLDNEIVVEIKDNGKGISKENLPFIFDRFYRADKSRNTSVVGSGLGLAISKQIIEKHGGKIWAESEENIGTSIFFSLKGKEGRWSKP
ncbi:HAMP domain-containing sensor histidine kinase [Wukongibacter baidiensis]|uniref:sensor histidine kinase n=1 Tax=Wukongibacter baidiensis TaxID=1723361 RepID=UPI003D7FB0D6